MVASIRIKFSVAADIQNLFSISCVEAMYVGHPRGCKKSEQYPLFLGSQPCTNCFCDPCVVLMAPDFLWGFCSPHPANNEKHYRLYRLFWRKLKDLGLWKDEEYLATKETKTVRHDKRDIIPACVVKD